EISYSSQGPPHQLYRLDLNCKAPYSANSVACPERERMRDSLRAKGPIRERYEVPEPRKLTKGPTQDVGISQTPKTDGHTRRQITLPKGTLSTITNGQPPMPAPQARTEMAPPPRPDYPARDTTPPGFPPGDFNIAEDPDTGIEQQSQLRGRSLTSIQPKMINHTSTKLPPRARSPKRGVQSQPTITAARGDSTPTTERRHHCHPVPGEPGRVSALKNQPKLPLTELTSDIDMEITEMRARIKELEARKRNAAKAVRTGVSTPLSTANKKRRRVEIIDVTDQEGGSQNLSSDAGPSSNDMTSSAESGTERPTKLPKTMVGSSGRVIKKTDHYAEYKEDKENKTKKPRSRTKVNAHKAPKSPNPFDGSSHILNCSFLPSSSLSNETLFATSTPSTTTSTQHSGSEHDPRTPCPADDSENSTELSSDAQTPFTRRRATAGYGYDY
ncbi:hypothetical protein V8E51_017353, partial [Hyaloscypha variabilis]